MLSILSLLRPFSYPRSDDATTHIINAQSSTFSSVGHDQYNITGVTHIYSTQTGVSLAENLPPSQAPFNDAPIDNLSIHFTGRRKELGLIAHAFQPEHRRHIPLRCALFGNQGVGKSQLTYAWAKSTFDSGQNSYILWISATTVEKLYQGFCRLLHFVDHPDRLHPDQSVRLTAARRWLEEINTGNWLLVLDNVFPETLGFLRQHLPRRNGRGSILITTRTEHVAVAVARERHAVIEIPLLDVNDAIELFLGHFHDGEIDAQYSKLEAIVKAVGRLPLAIAHAAAYAKQSNSTLDDMLALYNSEHKIDLISWEHSLSEYEYKSVAATFTSQLQDLEQKCPGASNFFRVLAFLDHESIPLEMLITGANAIVQSQSPVTTISSTSASLLTLILSPLGRQNAIFQLQSRCLVTYHSHLQSPTFRIHDLIQLVVLENTRTSDVNQELYELAVALVCAAFSLIEMPSAPEWWPRCELLVPHIQSLEKWHDISDQARKQLLLVNHRRGVYLSSCGRYADAQDLYRRVITDMEQHFDPEELDPLPVKDDLAWVYRLRGRLDDAEELLDEVLQCRINQLGHDHRHTLRTQGHLAAVYTQQQCNNAAENLLKQTLETLQGQSAAEDIDTSETKNMLAIVYRSQKQYDQAENLLLEVLQAREKSLGSDHDSTLATKYELANVYHWQRRYDAAAALFQQVLSSDERRLGSQHPDTLATMYALGGAYHSQGRDLEAERLLVHVLAGEEDLFGVLHPHTQMTVKTLVSVYRKLGRFDDAKMLEQRIPGPPSGMV